MTLTFLVALTSAFSEARVDESAMISSCPYSPKCVEKLFGNSELIPNRGYEAAKRGQRSPDRLPLGAKEECSRHLLLFSKQFRNRYSRKFISTILHNHTPVPHEITPPDIPHSPTPLELVTPMDRYARWWMPSYCKLMFALCRECPMPRPAT